MVNKDDYKQFSDKMDKTISLLKEQMNTVRAGRGFTESDSKAFRKVAMIDETVSAALRMRDLQGSQSPRMISETSSSLESK